ncbi:MAG: tetratricopeptide repeat protein [Anaerolineae bacterium]|nr:tetratricopeptide repeat protein [Gloeobacterales cyanobacterium ES-bin-313]
MKQGFGKPKAISIQAVLKAAFLHFQAGRYPQAEAMYQQVLAMQPNQPDAWYFLGGIACQNQNMSEGITYLRRALSLRPNHAEAHFNLANALNTQGNFKDASHHFQEAIRYNPRNADAHNNLGNLLSGQQKFEEAITLFQKALKLKPSLVEAHANLGNIFTNLNRKEEAIQHFLKAISLKPNYAECHYNLGNLLMGIWSLEQAAIHYQKAIKIRSNYAEAYSNLGNVLFAKGDMRGAIGNYRQALLANPNQRGTHTSVLFTFQYLQNFPEAILKAALAGFAASQSYPVRVINHPNTPDPERRLRIGYASPDFMAHSCAWFLEPLFEHHCSEQAEIFCYAEVPRPDKVTEKFRALADHWFDSVGVSDEVLVNQIAGDQIDILIDLAGHTSRNRLSIFAYKAAPVQVSWLGFPGSTGLEDIDYHLSDADLTPEASSEYFVEQVWNVPGLAHCYRPWPDAPDVGSLPALSHDAITFGSFNQWAKLTAETIHLWSQVLKAIPRSRLLLKSTQARDPANCQRIWEHFLRHGIAAERVELLNVTESLYTHLDTYNRIDIALDTTPYNGATTTCESLWMGVPVISLVGNRTASRYGYAFLKAVGLPELATRTSEDFVAKAVKFAGDLRGLSNLRGALRQRMQDSLLRDEKGFTNQIESAYRQMWKQWCNRQSPIVVSPARKATIIVDGVFFQRFKTGIARVWQSLLAIWANTDFAENLLILDRGGTLPRLPKLHYRTVPRHRYEDLAADQQMLQTLCDEVGATVFISTYYSYPTTTPSVCLLYDCIPEATAQNLDHLMWVEKKIAIQRASAILAISHSTARDLEKYYGISGAVVAHCGVSTSFQPAQTQNVIDFQDRYQICKPYFLLVGVREHYKNSRLFFEALAALPNQQTYEVVCTGTATFETQLQALIPDVIVHTLQLDDAELASAYSGAIALIYPSTYEGFGMPVLEAMACGCPVITTAKASLPEVGGDAVLYVGEQDVAGLTQALQQIQRPELRTSFCRSGRLRSQEFRWETMAETVKNQLLTQQDRC